MLTENCQLQTSFPHYKNIIYHLSFLQIVVNSRYNVSTATGPTIIFLIGRDFNLQNSMITCYVLKEKSSAHAILPCMRFPDKLSLLRSLTTRTISSA